ncbi:MAG: hypothetical protein AB7F88_18880 [Pyrinomonadaceae bacterium]
MAETLVEKEVCDSCGIQVRSGSAYCFNCGESVVYDPPPPAIIKPDTDPSNGGSDSSGRAGRSLEPEPPPVVIPHGSPIEEASASRTIEAFPAAAKQGRPPRVRVKKAAEVEWVERSPSSAGIGLAAVIFAVIAALLVAAAMYLR